MNEPLISVIVPAYNAERWLEECCRSVMDQDWQNWELILVDDGSADRTGAIGRGLERLDRRIRLIQTENGGVCHARNIGLSGARGDLIVFLDADDLLMTGALRMLYDLLLEQEADISIGWKCSMKMDGTVLGCPYQREAAVWRGIQGLEHSLLDHPATYAVWGKLYRRWVVEDLRFVEGRRVHEDSFFLFECLRKQPVTALGEQCVLYYRLSENSASRGGFSDKMLDILYFAERKYDLIKKEQPQLGPLAENMLVKAHMALLRNLCNTTDPKYRQIERDALRTVIGKKALFVGATEADRRWFFILTHRLYRLYKFLYRIRK